MTIRGVFLSFLILLIWTGMAVAALDIEGDFSLNSLEMNHEFNYNINYDLTERHQLSGNLIWDGEFKSVFQFRYKPNISNTLVVNYNHPHFTSTDSLRILHQDYFGVNKISLSYHHRDPNFVFFVGEEVPVNNGVPSLASYIQVSSQIENFNWQISGMAYDSGQVWSEITTNFNWDFRRNRGAIVVLEGEVSKNNNSLELIIGAQACSDEVKTIKEDQQGVAIIASGKFGKNLVFEPGIRYIGSDFDWPLTKTKPYPSDRKGFTTRTRFAGNNWRLTVDFDRLQRIDQTRQYLKSNLKLEYFHDLATVSLLVNWQPNQRITLGYKQGKFSFELRPDLPQIKISHQLNNHHLRLTSSSFKHHRIEYRYNGDLRFHYIYKLATPSIRTFCYSSVRFGNNDLWFQVSYGESDDGRLTSKFDHTPSWIFSWGWSW